jgi:hypothetical protein
VCFGLWRPYFTHVEFGEVKIFLTLSEKESGAKGDQLPCESAGNTIEKTIKNNKHNLIMLEIQFANTTNANDLCLCITDA